LNDTFNQLQSEFIALKTDSCKSQELAKQHEDTIETLTNEKTAITDQLADLQAKLTEIEERFKDLENDYAELKSNVTNLTTTDLALLQASVSRYIISNGDDHQFLFPSICTILGLNSQDLTRQRDEYKKSHTTVLQSATSAATWSSWMTVGSEFLNSTIQNLQQQNDTVINSSSPTAAAPASPRQGQ
jgi:predicted nuclease with TOPRIM domain